MGKYEFTKDKINHIQYKISIDQNGKYSGKLTKGKGFTREYRKNPHLTKRLRITEVFFVHSSEFKIITSIIRMEIKNIVDLIFFRT